MIEKKVNSGITIFSSEEFGQIRTTTNDEGDVLVCLVDVCKVLDLTPSKVVQRLEDDVLSKYPITDSMGRTQTANFINEDGFYDVVLESRKSNAKKFRKWVTSEVLPSIRKTGAYSKEGESVSVGQLMKTFSEYMQSQQLVNQLMVETLQALREGFTPIRDASDMFRGLGYKAKRKPLYVVEVSIIPSGERVILDYFDSHSLGYTKRARQSGSCVTFLISSPVESGIVREINTIINTFTGNPKWGRVRCIEI